MADDAELSVHISPTSGVPVYRQITEQIERQIDGGLLPPAATLPSVETTARRLAINPVAVSRAFHTLLERGRLTRDEDGALRIATDDRPSADARGRGAFLGAEPYVFVSYAHADRAIVNEEIRFVQSLGVNVWYDDGITPGESWDEEIATALGNCSLFLFFVTPASAASPNCRNELNFCLARGTRLLCVHLQETALPPGLELNLSSKQALHVAELGHAGYRSRLGAAMADFAREPSSDSADAAAGDVRVAAAPPGAQRTIAVLPLTPLGADADREALCRSLSEDIAIAVAALPGVTVVPQLDVLALDEAFAGSVGAIGRTLRCAHVLSGSLQRAGEQLRVRLQLARADDGESLWTGRFDGTATDSFAFQDELVAGLVETLRAHLP